MKRLSQRFLTKEKILREAALSDILIRKNFSVSFEFIWIFQKHYLFPSAIYLLTTKKFAKIEVSGANFYSFKVNNRSTGKRCEICSKLTVKTPERHRWRRSGVSIINFEHILILFYCFYCWLWEGKYFWIGSVELFSTAASVESQFSLLQKYLL